MKELNYALGPLLMLGSSACVPMEQSSLTYTSKTSMGVGVAAGTQDTPGLDVTIGFKEVNVALVPVAVAKYCYKATAEQCQNAIYQMRMVAGGKTDAIENLPIEKRIDGVNREVQSLFDQQKLEDDRRASLSAEIDLVQTADAADSELIKLGPALADAPPEALNARAALTARSALRPAAFDVASARKELAQLEAVRSARTIRLDSLRQEKVQLSGQLNANSNRQRTDAYSVYGKFSGGATGNGQGAGLTAGKVFATGVAAQNLTEFATTVDCLANIRLLAEMIPTDSAERFKLLNNAGELCKRGY